MSAVRSSATASGDRLRSEAARLRGLLEGVNDPWVFRMLQELAEEYEKIGKEADLAH